MVRFVKPTDMRIKVQITGPSGLSMPPFDLNSNGEFEVFPLSDGNGVYEIGVFEQVEGTRYAVSLTHSINVTLTNEFAPFLRSNQYVNFTPDSAIVQKAAELVGGLTDFLDKVDAIYMFVVNNITYDTDFAEQVIAGGHTGYIPVLDDVLARGYGICFDYAALMTGMLRSQGIPTKLVVGYAGDVLHAWISVFSEETGWIENAITFDGDTWNLMDPTFASTGGQGADVMQFIGDGANYNAMYLY
jgi:transglutaminase-like putative cysteine protease